MSFISCDNCGWEQDDFWSVDGYNPLRKDIIEWWQEIFAKGMKCEKVQMDSHWAEGAGIPYEIETRLVDGKATFVAMIDFRDMLVYELEHTSALIHNMEWPTHAHFDADELKACPQCGSDKDWDID